MSTEDCWVCGGKTIPKYRRVLNSESNSTLLENLRRIGALNLPSLLTSASERVYVCRTCLVETDKWSTLEKSFRAISDSIKAKLRSRGNLEESTSVDVSYKYYTFTVNVQ